MNKRIKKKKYIGSIQIQSYLKAINVSCGYYHILKYCTSTSIYIPPLDINRNIKRLIHWKHLEYIKHKSYPYFNNAANHANGVIHVIHDRSGTQVEKVVMLANCYPTGVSQSPNDINTLAKELSMETQKHSFDFNIKE